MNQHAKVVKLRLDMEHALMALQARHVIPRFELKQLNRSVSPLELEKTLVRKVSTAIKLLKELENDSRLDELPTFAWGKIRQLTAGIDELEEDSEEVEQLNEVLHAIINYVLPVNEAHLEQLVPAPLTTDEFSELADKASDVAIKMGERSQRGPNELHAAAGNINEVWGEMRSTWHSFVSDYKVKQLYGTIKHILDALGKNELEVALSAQGRHILAQGAKYWANELYEIAEQKREENEEDESEDETPTSAHVVGERMGRRAPAVLRAKTW